MSEISEIYVDPVVQKTLNKLQVWASKYLDILSGASANAEKLAEAHKNFVVRILNDQDIKQLLDSYARLAWLATRKSPISSEFLRKVVEDKTSIILLSNTLGQPWTRDALIMLVWRFATTIPELAIDHADAIEKELIR